MPYTPVSTQKWQSNVFHAHSAADEACHDVSKSYQNPHRAQDRMYLIAKEDTYCVNEYTKEGHQ